MECINDEKEFDVLLNALKIFQFKKDRIIDIFSILSGILHSGNIGYQSDGDHAKIKDKKSMELAAEFLGLNVKQFEKNITTKTIKIRNQETSTTLNKDGCINSRDSICKDIYDKLFNYLVKKINIILSNDDYNKNNKHLPTIGILDIFGFEIFDTNRFEQFCINYCNENYKIIFKNIVGIERQKYMKQKELIYHILNL